MVVDYQEILTACEPMLLWESVILREQKGARSSTDSQLPYLMSLGSSLPFNTTSTQNLWFINSHSMMFIVYETCIFQNTFLNYCSVF